MLLIYHGHSVGFQVPRKALNSPIPAMPGAPAPAPMAVEPSQGTGPAAEVASESMGAANGVYDVDTLPATINSPQDAADSPQGSAEPLPTVPVPESGVAEPNPPKNEGIQNAHQPEPVVPATPRAEGDKAMAPAPRRQKLSESEEFATHSVPPPELSTHAIKNRLRRLFAQRKEGSRLVDDRWVEAWNDTHGGGRDEILAMFEKVGYSPDRV